MCYCIEQTTPFHPTTPTPRSSSGFLIDLASMNQGMELAYLFLYKIPSSHDVHQALIFHTFINTNMLQSFKY
jgi:hypothetical protein